MSPCPYRVAVTSSSDFPVRVDIAEKVLSDIAQVVNEDMPFRSLSPEEEAYYGERLAGYDGLLVRAGVFSENLLKRLESVRVIAIHGAGVDQVDVAAAERLGIYVANAPGCNANAVVELTVGLMIDLVRRISSSAGRVSRDKQWGAARYLGSELSGRSLGLVGFGRIARGVATRALAFGMKVSAFDPYVAAEKMISEEVKPYSNLEDLLSASDIVSLHVPAVPETCHLINEERIKVMRPGSLLINTARGLLVDEKALYEALNSGHLGGAALDVLEEEPPTSANPLLALDSVIVTPHLGGSTQEALEAIAQVASEQIRSVLEGEVPKYAVNCPVSQTEQ